MTTPPGPETPPPSASPTPPAPASGPPTPPSGPPAPRPAAPGEYPAVPPGYPATPPPGYPGAPPPGYPAVPPPGYAYPPPAGYAYGVPPGYQPVVMVAPPPIAPGGQRLAEFGDRLVAFILDWMIMGVVTAIAYVPFYIWFFTVYFDEFFGTVRTVNQTPFPSRQEPDPAVFLGFFAVLIGTFVVVLLLRYVYEVEMMFRSGQTIGKRIMKVRVIPLDQSLTLTRGMAFKRYLVQYVAGAFVPGLTYLDGFWQLWDKPYRQCLHDKFATTVVIKLDS